jgi:Cu-Zn family superoxide dismutase
MKRIALSLAAVAALALPAMAQDMTTATANVMDLEGKSLGTLELTEMDGSVHISGELNGLPAGDHGIHIHEKGDCDAAGKFESAGAHFNPTNHQHGKDNPEGPHAGDLPNITVPPEGAGALVDLTSEGVTLGEGENSLFDADGSALVVHADPDDYKTDPSGNSGDRIACGVIEAGAGAK